MRRIAEEQAAELYDVRAGLFASAARLLATKVTPEQISELQSLLDRMEEAVLANSLDNYYPLNLEFHDSILRFAGNSRLHKAYSELVKELHLFRERALLQGGGLTVSNIEHRRIVAALGAGDATAAMDAAFAHVLSGKSRMTLPAAADTAHSIGGAAKTTDIA
jgi:DNA-binding GntR family transcriptional regulator